MANPRTTARFAKILLEAGVIDELQLRSLNSKMDSFNWSLPRAIAELGFADEDDVVVALGKGLKVPTLKLGNVLRDNGALKALSADYCEKWAVFPVTLKDRQLTLAMADPTDLQIVDATGSMTRSKVVPVLCGETQIRAAIAKHYFGKELPEQRRRTTTRSVEQRDPTLDEQQRAAPPQLDLRPEELQRLQAAKETQAKVSHILRTVQELLASKGLRNR